MKKYVYLALTILAFNSCNIEKEEVKTEEIIKYPSSRKVDTVDTYFGVKISDPYRWLEDDNSEETKNWVKEQNVVTEAYLSKIPFRTQLKERLTQLWNFEKLSAPFEKKDVLFFFKNDGIQNQSVLYMQKKGEEPSVLLDPNTLSADGTTSLNGLSIRSDAKYMAYSLAKAGSDWNTIQILDIETGKTIDTPIEWVKFSGMAWKGDGFFYSRYDEPKKGTEFSQTNEFQKVYFHKLGTSPSSDEKIYEDKENPLRTFGVSVTDDERFLVLSVSESTSGNIVMIKDLAKAKSAFVPIIDNFESEQNVVYNVGEDFYLLTSFNAPKNRLVKFNLSKPVSNSWTDIIPQTDNVMESVHVSGNRFIAKYLKDVSSELVSYNYEGKDERKMELPGVGIVEEISSKASSSKVYFSLVNYTHPTWIYQYDSETDNLQLFKKPVIDFDTDAYETKQVFYTSKDGTKIPMFITHKKGVKLDGNNPTFLFGYGGFNISYSPDFRVDRTIFLENGGVYAVANIRGGGEYGEEWHKAGTMLNKQNVFDDFIAAAEWLIENKYTSKDKLGVHGRSNGGLLAGAMLTQRPDLFKVVMPMVGVLDMLRFHKFTIGWAWKTDYGSSEDSTQFQYLLKYSPLHNVKEIEYPATMILTGDHDDRVVPAHSFKFLATLQEKQKGSAPILGRIDSNAGHGSGKPIAKQIEESADFWTFIFHHLGMSVKSKAPKS